MSRNPKTSRNLKIVSAIVVVIVAVVAIYGALTYPSTVLAFSVSFTIGADVQRRSFDVPFLDSRVEVEVAITSGSALWRAEILDQGHLLWNNTALQGGQTTYNSGWIRISPGNYNLTFGTFGAGSLSAEVTVTSKGGFW